MNSQNLVGDRDIGSRGLARRSDNYEALLSQCEEGRAGKLTQHEAFRAATICSRDLSAGAGLLLVTYLTFLDFRDDNNGSVWPGSSMLKQVLGVSDMTLRRYKVTLEEAGYLLRKYDQRNRPIHGDAIDLTPFLRQVPDILKAHNQAILALKEEKAAQKQHRVDIERVDLEVVHNTSKLSAQPLKTERHINSETYTGCLGDLKKDEEEFIQALKLSPILAKHLKDRGGQGLDQSMLVITEGLEKLLQAPSLANAGHSWTWAVNKFGGAGAFLRLAIAIESPKVRSRVRFFGWMVTNSETDLTANIERIREIRGQTEFDLPAEGDARNFAETLSALVEGAGNFNSWFGASHVTYEAGEGGLTLLVKTDLAKNIISDRYGSILTKARQKLGWTDKRIHIAVKGASS